MEEEKAPSFTQLQTQQTTYCLFFIWMIIGVLVIGNILGPILTIYIQEQSRCTHISKRTDWIQGHNVF